MAGRQRANGEGSIRERYPGCWEGRYTAGYDILTGKRIQKGVFAKTRKECAAKLARAIQQDTGPYYRKGKGYDSQPLSTWIRLWFDSYTKPNLRPSSADGYRSMIENHIIPVLGHIQLSKLSSIQIQRFYNDLHTQGRLDNHGNRKYEPLSASTVKHIHAVLSGALKQAVKERIIPFNPCDNCKIPKREKKEMHVLPQDKIGAYLDEAKRLGVYALFYLELTSGLRRGELLGLEWADLNPETRMLTVNKQLTRSGGELCISVPKTENSIRTIALPENTVALLIDEHNKHPDSPLMFWCPRTNGYWSPDSLRHLHKQMLAAAGVDESVRFHDLRHTFSTLAIQSGVDAKTVAGMLGHYMVKDLSRFGRNFLEMGNYLELILPLYGVRFISINDAFDSDDYLGVTGGLELALRNLINNMYSRDLSTKVRSAYRTRNLRGEYWGGNGFYGYQVHPHNKKRLIVDEQVRDIIVMIFESCVAGMTTSEIAQMLNDMGIPSPLEHKRRNGGFYNGVVKEETGIWLKGAVRKILTDERYTGKMITNTRETEEVGKPKMRSLPRDQWIIVPGTHEAIISEELFRAAQNALQGRIRNVNKNTAGNRANNLFVCGCCGRKLRKNPAKEPHLVCPKNDSIKGAECAGLFVNQAHIEQAVLQMLREQSRSFLEQHCLMQACIDKKLSSIQTELDANTNMTRRLQSRKAELYEQYRAGRISREKFADIQKTDSEKLARLSSRAEEIKRLLVEHYESRGNLAAGKRTADQIILLKDYDPEIIRNFVERVRVYPSGEIEIDMRTSSGFAFVTAS